MKDTHPQALTQNLFAREEWQTDELAKISVDILKEQRQWAKFVPRLHNAGVHNLGQLVQMTSNDFYGWRGAGRSSPAAYMALVETVREHPRRFIRLWEQKYKPYVLPEHYDEALTPFGNLYAALVTALPVFKERCRAAAVLEQFVLCGTHPCKIKMAGCRLSKERMRQIVDQQYLMPLIEGKAVGFVRLSDTLIAALHEERDRLMYRAIPPRYYESDCLVNYLHYLDMDVLKRSVIDRKWAADFAVPAGKVTQLRKLLGVTLRTVAEALFPRTPDELVPLVAKAAKEGDVEMDERFVRGVIADHPWMEDMGEGRKRLATPHLFTDVQQLGRLIADAGRPVPASEFRSLSLKVYGRAPNSFQTHMLKVHWPGFRHQGSRGWEWVEGSQQLVSVRLAIKQMVGNEVGLEFRLTDLMAKLREKGYTVYDEESIRHYVSMYCVVDDDNPDHYCHRAHLADFPQFRWHSTVRSGTTNKVLRDLYEAILKTPERSLTWKQVGDRAHIYGYAVRSRIYVLIDRFIARSAEQARELNLPFYKTGSGKNKRVFLVDEIARRTNWNTYGRRLHKNIREFNVLVYDEAIKILSAHPEHCMLQTQLFELCYEALADNEFAELKRVREAFLPRRIPPPFERVPVVKPPETVTRIYIRLTDPPQPPAPPSSD